jgi:hypothetical protein
MKHALAFISVTLLLLTSSQTNAQVLITNISASYAQDFDSLVSTGNSSSLPTGWSISESGTNADSSYAAGTGSSATGNTYSFGSAGSSDRALGGLQSGTLIPTFGVQIAIGAGSTNLKSVIVSYVGEQWRLGATNRTDRLDFQYSTNATSITTGTWTNLDILDFVAPTTGGTLGALNGNLAANRSNLSGTILSLDLSVGQSLWLRWNDFNPTGSDDGLGIDDFSVLGTFDAVPEPTSLLFVATAVTVFSFSRRRPLFTRIR